jgi:aminoglycoside phosphotransferase (APT) family kinase protein
MREDWPRDTAVIDLDALTIAGLIEPLFPGAKILEVSPVAGGLTNTNLRLRLSGRPEPLLLRFYRHSGDVAQREIALCRKLQGRVPVPNYLHFAPENPVTGHAFAVIDWINAKSLQDILPGLDSSATSRLGTAIGQAMAAIHAFTYPHFGYLDAQLNVPVPMDLSRTGLIAYLNFALVEGRGGPRLGSELTDKILAFAAHEGQRIEEWEARACLVHGDFNPSNLLVEPGVPHDAEATSKVAAVIDWEFAFSATPAFDFAVLLRPPLESNVAFIEGLEKGYRAAGGEMPPDWQNIARIVDLFSFADVLHHPETSAAVVEDMKAMLRHLVGQ